MFCLQRQIAKDETPNCGICGGKTTKIKQMNKLCNQCDKDLTGRMFQCQGCAERAAEYDPYSKEANLTYEVCIDQVRCRVRAKKNKKKKDEKSKTGKTKLNKKEQGPPPPLEPVHEIR